MINREKALELLKQHLKDQYTYKHSLALEAIMKKLAKKFNENEAKWGIAGLMHDIDWDYTKEDLSKHSLLGTEILEKEGFDKDILYAIKSHNQRHGIPSINLMDKCLLAADNLTGLITACTLVLPDKKLASLKPESVLKKFKDQKFAAATNREKIKSCEAFGIPIEEFIRIALLAMQEIAAELGL